MTVRVLPFATEDFAGAGHSMLYVHCAVPQLDTVQLDTASATEFLDAPTQLSNYRVLMERITKAALPAKESREFIRSIAQTI